MRRTAKVLVAVAAAGVLSTSIAACSSSGGGSAKPIADVSSLTGQSTSVALDPGFVKTLGTLGLKPGLTGKASMNGTTVTFPITGGNVKVYKKGDVTPYVQGQIDHQGSGLTLTGGKTVVTLENFVIDPGNNSKLTGDVLVDGKSYAKNVRLFVLDGSTLQPITVSGHIATLTGTTVDVSPEAAKALDTAFKTTAVEKAAKAGPVKVGIATLKVNVGS